MTSGGLPSRPMSILGRNASKLERLFTDSEDAKEAAQISSTSSPPGGIEEWPQSGAQANHLAMEKACGARPLSSSGKPDRVLSSCGPLSHGRYERILEVT